MRGSRSPSVSSGFSSPSPPRRARSRSPSGNYDRPSTRNYHQNNLSTSTLASTFPHSHHSSSSKSLSKSLNHHSNHVNDRSNHGHNHHNHNSRCCIIVHRLSKNVNKDHLKEIFGRFGDIADIHFPIDGILGTNRGVAYLTFGDEKQSQEAIKCMNEGQIDGNVISVKSYVDERRR